MAGGGEENKNKFPFVVLFCMAMGLIFGKYVVGEMTGLAVGLVIGLYFNGVFLKRKNK